MNRPILMNRLILSLLTLSHVLWSDIGENKNYSAIALEIVKYASRNNARGVDLDQALGRQVFDNLIAAFDPEKSLLSLEDVEELSETLGATMARALLRGDLHFVDVLMKRLKSRSEERLENVERWLDKEAIEPIVLESTETVKPPEQTSFVQATELTLRQTQIVRLDVIETLARTAGEDVSGARKAVLDGYRERGKYLQELDGDPLFEIVMTMALKGWDSYGAFFSPRVHGRLQSHLSPEVASDRASGRVIAFHSEDGIARPLVSPIVGPIVKIGQLRLPSFYNGKYTLRKDVVRILSSPEFANVDGIILDLRNNPGGSLDAAVDFLSLFVDRGPLVQLKTSHAVEVFEDNFPGMVYKGPLVVLTNRVSASASELVAGSLREYGRALIVGDSKTWGKGTVQSIVPLERILGLDGIETQPLGAVRLTSSRYYLASGHSLQKNGTVPHVIVPSYTEAVLPQMRIGGEFDPDEITPIETVGHNHVTAGIVKLLTEKSLARRGVSPGFQELEASLGALHGLKPGSLSLTARKAARAQISMFEEKLRNGQKNWALDPENFYDKEILEIAAEFVVLQN